MKSDKVAEKRKALLARKEQIRRDAEEAKKQITAEANEEVKRIEREMAQLEASERREQKRKAQRMAFTLGEFLLRNGLKDSKLQAIIKSPEFDQFLGSAKRNSDRRRFGLPEIQPPSAAQMKPAA